MKIIDLMRKQPFVYCVNGKHYYIGSCVCEECDETEIKLYDALTRELQQLKNEFRDLSKLSYRDVETLKGLFEKMKERKMSLYDPQADNTARGKMKECFENYDEDLPDIDSQWNDYKTIMNLCDGCFYRESNEYKKIK